MDDWQLLQDYVERDSDTAFRTLVNRYVNLVYSVALRQVQNAHLAEEVAQAVFILLARKARGLRRRVVLSGWLFRTTRFVASRAIRTEQRRQRREQEAFAMQRFTTPDEAWKRISPALDEALEHLGETDRNAVLLRFFNEKSHRETAAALGVSEEAAKKRVTRAVDKLRDFFASRGIALSAATLASVVAANAAPAAPAGVSIGIAAKVFASGSLASSALPQLVSQTLNAWRWAKLEFAGTLAVTIVATVVIVVALLPKEAIVSSRAAGNNDLASVAIDGDPSSSNPLSDQPSRAAAPGEQILRLRVIARDTGQSVSNAQLAVMFVSGGKWQTRYDLATDASGEADIPYPRNTGRLDVGVLSWGWSARFAEWKTANDLVIPESYTMLVDRMTNVMGGWLRDELGQPVANAEVEILFSYSDMANSETPRERSGFLHPAVVARSDQNGRWTCAVLDPKADPFPGVVARHPRFAPSEIAARHRVNDTNDVIRERMKLIWTGNLLTTMVHGLTLRGRVTDKDGQPISGARVEHNPASMFLGARYAEAETDRDGWFNFSGLPRGDFDFLVTAPGFAQKYQQVAVRDEMSPIEVTLSPGGLLRLRLVDERGDAVPEARAALVGLGGTFSSDSNWSAESGPDGRIEWNSAPPEKVLNLCASKHPDWLMTRDVMVKADGEEHVITLKRAPLVTGSVTDADSGEPIHGVKAFPGYGLEEYCWYRGDTWRSTNDNFQVRFAEQKFPRRVRVEAEGYVPFVSDPLPRDFNGVLDVALHRPDLSKAVRGVVLRPDGRLATGAEVALLTLGHGAYLGRACFAHREANDKLITNADGEGRFQFERDPDADTAHTIIALCESGFARILLKQETEPMTIQLEAWGRVEGTVDSSAKRQPIDSLYMQVQGPPGQPGSLQLSADFHVRSFKGDDFAFDLVPPGHFYVTLSAPPGVLYPEHHRTWLTVRAGETVKILVTERGHRLKGRLIAIEGEGDWTKQSAEPVYEDLMPGVRIHSRQYMAGKFAKLVPLDRELSPEENSSYNNSWETGLTPLQHNNSPGVRMDEILALASDGSFESLEGVLPGDYNLQVSINGRNFEQQTITVPEGVPSTIDLGSIMVNTNTPVTGRAIRSSGAAKAKSQ